MDRTELSGAIIHEVGAVFTAALTEAAPTLLTADLDGIERGVQAVSRQVMGRVVEQIIAVRAAAEASAPECGQCGRPMHRVGRARPRQLRGLVGDYTLRRPYYLCSAGPTISARPVTQAARRWTRCWAWMAVPSPQA